MDPLDVLPLQTANEHLNRTGSNVQPGGETELAEMIGAAVKRVRRHLGRDPVGSELDELLACKVVLYEYWRTQRPSSQRAGYAGQVGPNVDDGPASGVSITSKLTDLLGPPVAAPESQPQGGGFPAAEPWPDPVRMPTSAGWPR